MTLPVKTPRLNLKDSTDSRVQDNIAGAVDAVLGVFSGDMGDAQLIWGVGTPTSRAAQGSLFLSTSPGTTVPNLWVKQTTSASPVWSPVYSSARSIVGPWYLTTTTSVANTTMSYGGFQASAQVGAYVPPVTGSILAISAVASSSSAGTVTLTVFTRVAGTTSSVATAASLTFALSPTITYGYASFAQGAVPFGPGDRLALLCGQSFATATAVMATFHVSENF